MNVDGFYLLTDIGMLAKHEDSVSYLYFRNEGWKPDHLLGEYIFLGEGDFKKVSDTQAKELIEKFDSGEAIA